MPWGGQLHEQQPHQVMEFAQQITDYETAWRREAEEIERDKEESFHREIFPEE